MTLYFFCVLIAPTTHRQQQSIKTGTVGNEQSLAPMYYRNANCAVVVYDITQSVRTKRDMFVDEHCKWYKTVSSSLTIWLIESIYHFHLLIVFIGQGEVVGQGAPAPS